MPSTVVWQLAILVDMGPLASRRNMAGVVDSSYCSNGVKRNPCTIISER